MSVSHSLSEAAADKLRRAIAELNRSGGGPPRPPA
jgi:hypothetical protein